MSFNIAEVLGGAQVGHDGRMQIEYIRLDKILPDERNFYSMDDEAIRKLAGSIETIGLQQPLVVRPSDEAGSYIITSGHRRRAALEILWKADPMKWAEAPCIVQETDELPEMTELRLLLANSDTRKMTDADLATQVERIYDCLFKLKEQGVEFPGRMRDRVAEAVGVSKSKLGRLKIIRDGLQGEFRAQWEKGGLPESTAIALAKMEPAVQDEVFVLAAKAGGQTADRLDRYMDRRKKIPEHCNGLRSECQHAPVLREKMWKANSWEATCTGCCIRCDQLEGCRDACTWCQAVVDKKARLKAETKAKRREEKLREEIRAMPAVEYLSSVLGRAYNRMKAQGLSAPDLIKCGTRTTEWGFSDAYSLLDGSKVPKEYTKLPIAWGYSYGDCQGLIDAARKLGCSIDWLLTGEEAKPSVPNLGTGWKTGEPKKTGWYLAAYELVTGKLFYGGLYWMDSRWLMRPEDDSREIDAGIVKHWIELPEGDSRG